METIDRYYDNNGPKPDNKPKLILIEKFLQVFLKETRIPIDKNITLYQPALI